MKLETFRVRNYRSINDSGDISVSRITALLGRNESGKSNLLRALHSLNPVEGFKVLSPIKDFPRHRRLEECNESTEVLSTTWLLEDEDRTALQKIVPRATAVKSVVVARTYHGTHRAVSFPELGDIFLDEGDIRSKYKKIAAGVRALAAKRGALLH